MAVAELVEGLTLGSKKLVHITDIRGSPEHIIQRGAPTHEVL